MLQSYAEVKDMARKSTDAQIRAATKYAKTHVKQISFKLNVNTDADVIDKLANVPNIRGYLLQLIRADIEKDNG